MPEHNTLTDTRLNRQTAAPSAAPEFEGQTYIQDETADNRCIRVATGTATSDDFAVFGFVPRPYSGNPDGVLVSRCAWDLTIDTVNNELYYSNVAGSTTWRALNGIPSGGGD